MAIVCRDPFVDQLVYRAFKPMNPGRITKVETSKVEFWIKQGHDAAFALTLAADPGNSNVTVEWLDGSSSVERASFLQDFQSLINDHKRKYEKFSLMKSKLRPDVRLDNAG